jgi:hypothetical protein
VSTNGSLIPNTMNGNYWDRYAGYDLDRDGHGDVPHRPLGFFTLLVEMQPYAMVFSRSLFVSLLDRAERLIPSLTPESMKDDRPLMRPPVRKNRAVAVANKRLFPHSAFVIFHSSFFIPAGMGLNEKWRTSEHSVVLVHPFIFPLGGRYYDHG